MIDCCGFVSQEEDTASLINSLTNVSLSFVNIHNKYEAANQEYLRCV